MTLGPAAVRRWDAGALESVVGSLGRIRDRLLDLDDDLGRARTTEAAWSGRAADTARTGHDALTERLRRLVAGATAARIALAGAADELVAVQAQIRGVEDRARARGFAVAADGTVTDTRQVTVPSDQVAAHRRRREAERSGIVGDLRVALERAAALDARLLAAVQRVALDRIDEGAAATLTEAALSVAGPAPGPPADATPQQNADWWRGLPAAAREHLLLARPDLVGNLDGVPAAVRDHANRARLPDEIARADAALAAAIARLDGAPVPPGARPGGTVHVAGADVGRLTERRDALREVSRVVEAPGRRLLLLDVDGHREPRAAVADGDVDTAAHVAVFTPGFTSTVATDLGNYVEDMAGVRRASDALLATRGGASTATVTWMGYDAPQVDTTADPARSVLLPFAAERGGDQLARFYQGIVASRPGHAPHLVALGHSYGSTTTGYALRRAPVDDAVFFGSPGLSTSTVSDLRVPPGHIGVIEARNDVVADLGAFGHDPNHLDGVVHLESGAATGPDGRPLRESVEHRDYLTPGSTSQHNIAATVAGLPEQRVTGRNTGLGDYLGDPVRANR